VLYRFIVRGTAVLFGLITGAVVQSHGAKRPWWLGCISWVLGIYIIQVFVQAAMASSSPDGSPSPSPPDAPDGSPSPSPPADAPTTTLGDLMEIIWHVVLVIVLCAIMGVLIYLCVKFCPGTSSMYAL
jgi:hypothetical protein